MCNVIAAYQWLAALRNFICIDAVTYRWKAQLLDDLVAEDGIEPPTCGL
jgi:hypothetical protein